MGRHVDRGVARGSWLTKWPLQRLRTSRGGSVSQKAGAGDGRGLCVLAPLNVLPQGAVDFGLISPPARRSSLEPSQHVGVQAQCYLFLDRAIEEAALGVRPILGFGDVARIDLSIGKIFGR